MRRLLLTGVLFSVVIFTWTSLVLAGQRDPARTPTSSAGTGALPATMTATTMRPTATIDRLAAPPTVYPPTQADEGAQLFWLYCQPCHGDQGQGLTDEWRMQYPEEHQNCWGRGCHAESPYPDGFTLPTSVPALIGLGSLSPFQTVGQLYYYIRQEMPYEYPGSLTEDEYLAISAFLARAHGAGDGRVLTAENVQQIRLQTPPIEKSGTPVAASVSRQIQEGLVVFADFWTWNGIVLFLLLLGGAWLVIRRRSP